MVGLPGSQPSDRAERVDHQARQQHEPGTDAATSADGSGKRPQGRRM